jgi:protein-tyrosine kinase
MSRSFDILRRQAAHNGQFRPASVLHAQPEKGADGRTGNVAIDEEIAKLIQRVFLLSSRQPAPAAVAFCGVDQNVGCTWVCARAAEALAEHVSARVCVVDGNFRSPRLHDHFRLERGSGFADAIKTTRPLTDFVRPTWTSNLSLLTAGATGSEPAAALNPGRLRERIVELRDQFDYVLVDTPALRSYADAAMMGLLTDGVVLVVASNVTRREPARRAKEDLEAAKVPILGVVLNRRTYPIPEALYQIL